MKVPFADTLRKPLFPELSHRKKARLVFLLICGSSMCVSILMLLQKLFH